MSVDHMLFRNSTTILASPTSIGDTTVVTVPASKRFKLISSVMSATGGANQVSIKTGAVPWMSIAVPATAMPVILPYNPAGWLNGALDGDFIVGLTAATVVQCSFTYILMDS